MKRTIYRSVVRRLLPVLALVAALALATSGTASAAPDAETDVNATTFGGYASANWDWSRDDLLHVKLAVTDTECDYLGDHKAYTYFLIYTKGTPEGFKTRNRYDPDGCGPDYFFKDFGNDPIESTNINYVRLVVALPNPNGIDSHRVGTRIYNPHYEP